MAKKKNSNIAADAGASLTDRVLYLQRLAELEAARKAREQAQKLGQAKADGFAGALNYAVEQNILGRGLTNLGTAAAEGVQQGANVVNTGVSILRYSNGNPAQVAIGLQQIAEGALRMGIGWNKAASSLLSAVPAPVRNAVANYVNKVVSRGKIEPAPASLVDEVAGKKPTSLSKKEADRLQKAAQETATTKPRRPDIAVAKSPDEIAKSIDDATAQRNKVYGESIEETKDRLANDIYRQQSGARNLEDVLDVDEFGRPKGQGGIFDDIEVPVRREVTPNASWADEYQSARAAGQTPQQATRTANTRTGQLKKLDDVNPLLSALGRQTDDVIQQVVKKVDEVPTTQIPKPIPSKLTPKTPIRIRKPDVSPSVPIVQGFQPRTTDTYVPPFVPTPQPPRDQDNDGIPDSIDPDFGRKTQKDGSVVPRLITPPSTTTPTPSTTTPTPSTGTPGTSGNIVGGLGGIKGTGGSTGTGGGVPGFAAAAAAQAAASQAAVAAKNRALSNRARDIYATGVMRALSRAGDVYAGRSQARLGQQLTGVGRQFQQQVAENKQQGIVDQDTLTQAYIESLSSGYGGQAQDALRRYQDRAKRAQQISGIGI
jgi:hypothetical protein